MRDWLAGALGTTQFAVTAASSDASFRRYWRVRRDGDSDSRILMDAPPGLEDCSRFVELSSAMRAVGINTPEVQAADLAQGFVLLADFGQRHYLEALTAETADGLYADALVALLRLQSQPPPAGLPSYDAPFLRRELDYFDTWFLEGLLAVALEPEAAAMLTDVKELLVANALEQPQVWVHRDFHSRNLMLTEVGNPGVLDFQDAVVGPLTYDLVSLLRDCYIAWPQERVQAWALDYFASARACGLVALADETRFLRWMDLMGLQRHLKVCGIFARLHLRDGKSHYLADLPLTLHYIATVSCRYPELAGLAQLVEQRLLPVVAAGTALGQMS